MAKKTAVKEKCEEKYSGRKGSFPGMEIKTPYPKKRFFTNDIKLTILILLWLFDKIVMFILFWAFN